MKAADLRKAILQAAVQGRLVPQDKNDEPASELLKRIQAEKAALVKNGKLKKEKPLPPISEDETPYDLPKGWEWERVGALVFNRDCERIPVSRADREKLKKEYDNYGASGVIDKINDYLFDETLLLVGEDGANLLARSTPIAFLAHGKYWVNNHAHVLDSITKEFLYYLSLYINAIDLSPYVTGTAQPKMNQEKMNSILVAVPPQIEQKRIFAKVDELMAMCYELEAAEKELDTLESHLFDYLPKSILQAAVQGKLVPQDKNDEPASELLKRIQAEKAILIKEGKLKKEKPLPPITEDEIPYDLPEGWVWCRAIDVCSYIQRGKSPTYSETKTYPVVSQKCVQWKGMDMSKARFIAPETVSKYEGSRKLTTGDLLWNSTGQGTLGRIAIYDERLNPYKYAVADSHVTVLRPLQVLSKYMYYWFAGPEVQSTIEERATGSTKQIELATSTIMSYIFPLPPLEEQQRIVTKVDELMALCDELKRVAEQPINQDNVVQFPMAPKENIEPIAMAARGKVEGMSDQAKQAIEDLFGEDE